MQTVLRPFLALALTAVGVLGCDASSAERTATTDAAAAGADGGGGAGGAAGEGGAGAAGGAGGAGASGGGDAGTAGARDGGAGGGPDTGAGDAGGAGGVATDGTPPSDAGAPPRDAAGPGTDAVIRGDATPPVDGGGGPPADGAPDTDAVAPAPELPDLQLLPEMTIGDTWIDERDFAADSCAMVEGCITQPGRRKLLRFGVSTANVGDVDLVMGRPDRSPELFEYSACHDHYHFNSYAAYELRTADGELVAPGHKQAFCLLDSNRYLTEDPTVRERGRYSCDFQGISRGWFDSYTSRLDCQWIDITDLPPGHYALGLQINPERVLQEKRYDNNDAVIELEVPAADLTRPCGEGELGSALRRGCGWEQAEIGHCAEREIVTISAGACGQGMCEGNPMMRVCEGEGTTCFSGTTLGDSDDACLSPCPGTQFRCPPSGTYTVYTASEDVGQGYVANLQTTTAEEPPVTDACVVPAESPERGCGWDISAQSLECSVGFEYTVGCAPMGCGAGNGCDGDPVMRVCAGDLPCPADLALASDDDSCDSYCPSDTFICPVEGRVTVLTAPYRSRDDYQCQVQAQRSL